MVNKLHGEILIPTNEINQSIRDLGFRMASELRGRDPVMLGILTGAYVFTTKVVDAMVEAEPDINPIVDFLRISTYQKGQELHKPEIIGGLASSTELQDRVVVITEDIIESGYTAEQAVAYVYSLGAAQVKLAAMLARRSNRSQPVKADYVATVLKSSKWVVGMGLDGPGTGAGGGRSFPYIAECLVQPKNS